MSTSGQVCIGGGRGLRMPGRRRGSRIGTFALAASLAWTLAACQGAVTDLSLADYDNLMLTLVSGDELAGTVGQLTDDRVRIRVTDDRGRPVSGVSVEFRVLSLGGQVTPTFVRSDNHGLAEADWTLGKQSGEQQLEVVGTDQRRPQDRMVVRLPARARPTTPESIELSPAQVIVKVGETMALTAVVRDQFGNPTADVPVQWSINAPGVARLAGVGFVQGLAPGTAIVEVLVPGEAGPAGSFSANSGPAASPGNGGRRLRQTSTVTVVESTDGEEPVQPTGNPGHVTDLSIASVTDSSIILRFTQVSDGAGGPASYAVRSGSPHFNGPWNSRSSTERTFGGTAVGAEIFYEYTGLQPGTTYAFRVQAYRNVDGSRVNGEVSGAVSGVTASKPPPPGGPYTVTISPSALTLTGVDATSQLSATVRDGSGSVVSDPGVAWSSLETSVATISSGGIVTARAVGTALIVASAACCGATDTIAVHIVQETVAAEPPAQVTDLRLVSATEGAVVLRWTGVDDGTGQPASYALRHQTPQLVWWEAFPSEVLVQGAAIGQPIEYKQNSLSPDTDYEFRLVAYRGTMGEDAAFGPLSNVVGGRTEGAESGEPKVGEPDAPQSEGPPVASGNAPRFGDHTADQLIWQDDFNVYTCMDTLVCGSAALTSNYTENQPEFNTWARLASGRGGSTNSLELRYGADQAYDLVLEKSLGGNVNHLFFSIWFRTTPGWDPSSHRSDGIKGFMLGHELGGGLRHQFGPSKLRRNGAAGDFAETRWTGAGREEQTISGGYWDGFVWDGRKSDDEGIPWNGGSAAASTPWPNGMNDGQWHHSVIEVKASGPDQYVRWWVDGVLAWDDSGKGHEYPRVFAVRFFGNYARSEGAQNGSIFFDDMVIWKR